MADWQSVHTNSTRSIGDVEMTVKYGSGGGAVTRPAAPAPTPTLPTIKEVKKVECEWSFPHEFFMILASTIAFGWTWYITLATWIKQNSTITGEDFFGVVILTTVTALFAMFMNSISNSIAFRNGKQFGACGCICDTQIREDQLEKESHNSMTLAFWEMGYLLISSGFTLFYVFDVVVFVTDDITPLVSLGIWYYVPTLLFSAMLIYHACAYGIYHTIAHYYNEDHDPPIKTSELLLYIFIELVCIASMIYLEPVSFDRIDKTVFNNAFVGMAVGLGVKLLIALLIYLVRSGSLVKFLKYVWCCKCRIVKTTVSTAGAGAGADVGAGAIAV